MVYSDRTVVVLLLKHFLFIPSPLILPALSQIVSMLLWASLILPYTRVIQKISSICECCYYTPRLRWCTCVPSLLILWQGTDAVHRHSNSVYALCCVFIIIKKIENPTACEMRSVIRFLNVKNMKPGEIRQLCDVYGEHAVSSLVVQRCVWLFNEDVKMCIVICGAAYCLWWSLLHRIVSDKFEFQKLCANWVLKVFTEEHKLKWQASTLDSWHGRVRKTKVSWAV